MWIAALALAAIAAPDLQAADKGPAWVPPAAVVKTARLDDRLAAKYEGGEITIDELGAKIRTLRRNQRTFAVYSSYQSMYEDLTLDLVIHEILLKEAKRLKLRERPDWSIREVLFEQAALADLMRDAAWDSIKFSDDELQQFVRDHPDVLQRMPGGNSDAKWVIPSQAEFLAWTLRSEKYDPFDAAMREEATDNFPIVCLAGPTTQPEASESAPASQPVVEADTPASQPSGPLPAVFECGTLRFSAADYANLFDPKFSVRFTGCGDLTTFQGAVGENLSLGELARSKGYRQDPRFEEVLRFHREKWLTEQAKDAVIDEWSRVEATSEERIRDYYDNEMDVQQDPLLTYDLFVAWTPYQGQSPEDWKAIQAANEAKAEQIIGRIKSGTPFDDIPKSFTDLMILYEQRREVKEDSPLYALLEGVEPGQILNKPYPDYGGFCVIRVTNLLPRRKMPFEFLRVAAISDLEFRHRNLFRGSFTLTILDKHECVLNRDSLTRMVREGAKP